ncbi:unnamed protein product [Paramecium pentaurelia]|uniref:Uncharacterized protein n=1 Tax=Paramecium pentaurelia TaxID=43138 RepID=A0A8S1Y2L4_9CILI|nr:unnamed protein product [Paramecium pentaurelia]
MTTEYSFDINISINSDEEMRQIKIYPFQTNFQHYNKGITQIDAQDERVNQPAPSPEYKFMGVGYSNDETSKSQSVQPNLDKCRLQTISQCTINVSKSVDIYLDNKRNKDNNNDEIFSMKLIKMNMLKNKNAVQNNKRHQTKFRNYKNAKASISIRNLSPQGILKISSYEWPLNKNTYNLQYHPISNKKVSFEFTQEQIKNMKRINITNVLIKQKTRYVLN